MKYNPFAYLRSEKDILKLVNTIIANTKGDGEKSGEDFWVKAEKLYYTALQYITDTFCAIPLQFVQVFADRMILVAGCNSPKCFIHVFLISQIIIFLEIQVEEIPSCIRHRADPVIPPENFHNVDPLVQQVITKAPFEKGIFF